MGNKKTPTIQVDRNGNFIIGGDFWKSYPGEEFKKMLNENDYVKVVRCKDCVCYGADYWCAYWEDAGMEPTDYCSKGERKEDAN